MNTQPNTNVIKKLHVTEKTSLLSEAGVYSFLVETTATKKQIAKNVTLMYKVIPVKVSIVNSKAKAVFSRGKVGKTRGFKKAYVYLKKGDVIDIA